MVKPGTIYISFHFKTQIRHRNPLWLDALPAQGHKVIESPEPRHPSWFLEKDANLEACSFFFFFFKLKGNLDVTESPQAAYRDFVRRMNSRECDSFELPGIFGCYLISAAL